MPKAAFMATGASSPSAPLIPSDGLTPTQLAEHLGVAKTAVHRWIRDGLRGPAVNGHRPVVRLEAKRIGGRVVISLAAYERFSAALSNYGGN